MKIVRQLAEWMLENGRLSPERYREIKWRILGEHLSDEEDARLDRLQQSFEEAAQKEASEIAWWDLHGAGARKGTCTSGRRKAGRRKEPGTKAIKVWDLEPKLPDLLMKAEGGFPLGNLLVAVAHAAGVRCGTGWAGFAEAVAQLYKADADVLHAALHTAVVAHAKAVGGAMVAMEEGEDLFPSGFLSGLSGQSVSALRKRMAGDTEAFRQAKTDWILRYANFSTLNEACIVRNRLRRIFRLWIREGAEFDEDKFLREGALCAYMVFGKRRIDVPLALWLRLCRPCDPLPCGLKTMPLRRDKNGDILLEVSLDGGECVWMRQGPASKIPMSKEDRLQLQERTAEKEKIEKEKMHLWNKWVADEKRQADAQIASCSPKWERLHREWERGEGREITERYESAMAACEASRKARRVAVVGGFVFSVAFGLVENARSMEGVAGTLGPEVCSALSMWVDEDAGMVFLRKND